MQKQLQAPVQAAWLTAVASSGTPDHTTLFWQQMLIPTQQRTHRCWPMAFHTAQQLTTTTLSAREAHTLESYLHLFFGKIAAVLILALRTLHLVRFAGIATAQRGNT